MPPDRSTPSYTTHSSPAPKSYASASASTSSANWTNNVAAAPTASVKEEDDSTQDAFPARKQTARRRAYAKRSCLKCREKKARCELPDLTIPSTMQPLSVDKACHRCKVLSLDCIVWDGDRKRKPKIGPAASEDSSLGPFASASSGVTAAFASNSSQAPSPSARLDRKPANYHRHATSPSSNARSPGSLEQLAAAAAHLSDQRGGLDDMSESSPHANASTDASSSREHASTLASVQFFNPTVERPVSPPLSSSYRRYAASGADSSLKHGARPPSASPLQNSSSYPPHKRPKSSPDSLGADPPPSHVQPPGRTWTSLWRPLSVLIDYAAQQPSFTNYLLSRIDTSLRPGIDVVDLVSKQTCLHLKPFIRPYLLWHPHLPALEAIYEDHLTKPTSSSALLLSSMCLVACRHAMPLTDELPCKLSALIDQLGTQILLSNPRDLYTVQALELLLAHEPSLVGTKVAGSAQAERGNGLLGESLLAAALTVARGLDLDKALDEVLAIVSRPYTNNPNELRQRRTALQKAMSGASIWISLRLWEGHFSFVNSTIRPIDLADMVAKSKSLIAIDSEGHKIERKDRNPFVVTEHRFPGLDEDSVLRSAGRTGLVYRLQSMARFQDAIAEWYRILAEAPVPPVVKPGDIPTTEETRKRIVDALTRANQRRDEWEYFKTQDFAVFATVRPALLLEDWATMESYSLHSLLPPLAICAFMTGDLNRGFSAMEMVEHLRLNISFRDQGTRLSEDRDSETHKMLSAFHMYDRGLGYSKPDLLHRGSQAAARVSPLLIEATGAPLLLTTAMATDGCKMFLEKTACSLAGFDHLPVTVNMHLAMMVRTIQRLEECDRNEYAPKSLPARKRDRRSASLHDRHARYDSVNTAAADDDDAEAEGHGKSISQIGIMFIEDMTRAMDKWKLGASLRRPIAYHERARAAAMAAAAASLDPSKNASSQQPVEETNGTNGATAEATARGATPDVPSSVYDVSKAGRIERNTAPANAADFTGQHEAMFGSNQNTGQASHQQMNGTQFHNQSRSSEIGNGNSFGNGNGHRPEALVMPSPSAGFMSTVPALGSASSASNGMGGGSGQGGMFDIPMFDGMFDPCVTTEQWANSVPWFDPVIEGANLGLVHTPAQESSQQQPTSISSTGSGAVMSASTPSRVYSGSNPGQYQSFEPASGAQNSNANCHSHWSSQQSGSIPQQQQSQQHQYHHQHQQAPHMHTGNLTHRASDLPPLHYGSEYTGASGGSVSHQNGSAMPPPPSNNANSSFSHSHHQGPGSSGHYALPPMSTSSSSSSAPPAHPAHHTHAHTHTHVHSHHHGQYHTSGFYPHSHSSRPR